MNLLKQLTIFACISFFCELISNVLPFPFPASVLAMIVLFLLLILNLIKVKSVKETGEFLQKNMSLFLISSAISIMEQFDVLKDKIFQIVVICFISFLITFLITVSTVNLIIKIQNKFKESNND